MSPLSETHTPHPLPPSRPLSRPTAPLGPPPLALGAFGRGAPGWGPGWCRFPVPVSFFVLGTWGTRITYLRGGGHPLTPSPPYLPPGPLVGLRLSSLPPNTQLILPLRWLERGSLDPAPPGRGMGEGVGEGRSLVPTTSRAPGWAHLRGEMGTRGLLTIAENGQHLQTGKRNMTQGERGQGV